MKISDRYVILFFKRKYNIKIKLEIIEIAIDNFYSFFEIFSIHRENHKKKKKKDIQIHNSTKFLTKYIFDIWRKEKFFSVVC